MRGKKLLCLAVTAMLMLAGASGARAAGFALYEWSAQGNAMGGNLTGVADPVAVAYSPAGIVELDTTQVSAGVSIVAPKGSVNTTNMYNGGSASADMDELYHPLPSLFMAGPLKTWEDGSRLSYGLGVFTRFGLTSKFDQEWDGRYNNTNASIMSASLQPTIAYGLGNGFSVAVGADIMYFDLKLEQTIDATKLFYASGQVAVLRALGLPTTINDPSTNYLDVNQSIKGNSYGIGGVVALQYKPVDYFAASLTYRSQVRQKVNGTATFEPSSTVKALLPGYFYTTGADGEVTLPDSTTLGLMYKPAPRWTIGAGLTYTRWSTYDALTVNYDNATYGVSSVTSEKHWNDVWRASIAVQWRALDWLELRANYIYDQSPIDEEYSDYMVPTADRNIVGVGAGFIIGESWHVDVSYSYLMVDARDYPNRQVERGVLAGSTDNSSAQIIGVNVGYAF